jgi:putative transposase
MPRAARFVVPGLPHHVTQRGNRQQPIFFSDADRTRYLEMLAEGCGRHGTRCLAWCLMDNHVHLILTPSSFDGLRATIASTHTRYAQRINYGQGVGGHLFQGRFASYPMDDAHLMVAVRYVENNPVKAGLCRTAEELRWSSARAHVTGVEDGLTDVVAIGQHVRNWRAYLADGLEAADRDEAIEAALLSGRPLGNALGTVR